MSEKDKLKRRQLTLSIWKQMFRIVLTVALAIVFVWLVWARKDNHLSLDTDQTINITPEQIQSIRNIGEWEFLAVSDEELVDTVRRGLLRNDELVRIYYGTLRLGINLHQAKPGWLTAHGDTLTARLPAIGLLDQDFIDEARTRSFYETGRWSAADREALYRKAYRMMLSHCLTPANLRSAQDNADAQLRSMFSAMGYKNIVIRFENE
jgi:hypothetical protein